MPSSRRQFLAGTVAGCAALSGCAASGESTPTYSKGTDDATEWRHPDYGPSSTAYSPDAAGPRDGVSERWTADIHMATGRPVVADGTVFAPTSDGLVAFDLASGDERWTFSLERDPWTASPTVRGDTIYVGCAGEDGLWALDAATGEQRWRLETRGAVRAEILPSHNGERLYAGDDTGRVYVVRDAEGTVEHTYDAVGPVTALCSGRTTVVVGTEGGQVYELYDDGEEFYPLWQRRVEGGVQDLAVLDGGSVAVSVFGDYVYRLQNGAHAGSSRWETEFTANDFVAAKSHVVGTNLARLASIEGQRGEKRWSRSGNYGCAPAGAGDTFYVGADYESNEKGGYLAAYPLGESGGLLSDTPDRRWKRDLPGVPTGGLAVADGALIATTRRENDGTRLRVFDPA